MGHQVGDPVFLLGRETDPQFHPERGDDVLLHEVTETERLLSMLRDASEKLALSAVREQEAREEAERQAAELEATISAMVPATAKTAGFKSIRY